MSMRKRLLCVLSIIVLPLIIFAFLFIITPIVAGEVKDTENATEGEIKGSAAIGMGPRGEAYIVIFAISSPWLETGIEVERGDVVSITATPSETHPPCDGRVDCPPYRNPDDIIADGSAGENLTAAVGKIMTDEADASEPFSIGSEYVFTTEAAGRILVGYNDCADCFEDNTGAFEFTITVEK
jgi:hypothetical protein